MKSLSRSFLIGVGVTSVTLTLLGFVVCFLAFRADLGARQMRHQAEYLDERVTNLARRFGAISQIHAQAGMRLEERLHRLSAAQADRIIDARLPLQADGTRRSRPEDFDGKMEDDGDYTHGLGAFFAHGAAIDPLEKRVLAASVPLVNEFGEAIHSSYDNFYFATPNNRMVMYAPDRPDHLLFYRKTAPATLDFSGEEMMRMVQPIADPSRRTRCTSLQRLIQDKSGKRLATACLTPFYYEGRYVGAFGSSLSLNDFLAGAVGRTMRGATSLIVRSEGDIIAYPGLTPGEAPSPEGVARLDHDLGVQRLLAAIKAGGKDRGLMKSPDGRNIIAYGKIVGPDWYLLLVYPTSALEASALRSASWLLALGLLAAVVQTALLLAFARRKITDPLRLLADSCSAEHVELAGLDAVRQREDEIGVLARALVAERENSHMVLASLEDRVQARTVELEQAVQEKSRFLANMSHELRTPLNGIIAVSEALSARQESPDSQELAELIVTSSRLLERVLGDILDFSSLESGKVVLLEEAFDLTALVEHTGELHKAVARAKALDLTWSIDHRCRGRFKGDAVRLAQVLSNLLGNAIKFTSSGWVSLRVEPAGAGVRFIVTDTGIGFDTETRDKLFTRFEQGDASIRRRFGGTGLGLAICRALVEAMGGTISASSSPGVGSKFMFEAPLRAEAGEIEAPAAGAEAGSAFPPGLKVLLAEDHPTNQKVIALILSAVGVELTVVENGRQALEADAAQPFDLILMDMMMPELDGVSATMQIREREAASGAPRRPIIMLTANALEDHRRQSLAAGADLHVTKPIRTTELLEAISLVISEEPKPKRRRRTAA